MDQSFADQYKDPRWKQLRKEIIQYDDFECQRCGATHQLQVHHMYYKNGAKVWWYVNEELITLCKPCHEKIHKIKDSISNSLDELQDRYRYDTFFNYEIAEIVLRKMARCPNHSVFLSLIKEAVESYDIVEEEESYSRGCFR